MSERRVASLDGVRAISILLVVAFHINVVHEIPGSWRFDFGNLGVRSFFVISGFLITMLLLKELDRTKTLGLREFYFRRALRILPAYYVFLAVMAALVGLHLLAGRESGMLPALFYYSNYKLPFPDIQQTWSLSVEEQFYFLWPAAIVFFGLRRATRGCTLVLLIAPLMRVLCDLNYWHVANEEFAFGCACDALATGCLLAIHRERLWRIEAYRNAVTSMLPWGIVAFALAIWAANPPPIVRDIVSIPALNVGIAMLIDRYIRMAATTAVGRTLNFGPVVWLGTISYSLYLWQQPWMFSHLAVPLRIAGAATCAIASYYLVELPALRIRNRIAWAKAPQATAVMLAAKAASPGALGQGFSIPTE